MNDPDQLGATQSLNDLLDRIDAAAGQTESMAVGDIVEAVGTRSFSPVLLIAGLVMITPIIGDIPGVPVLMGVIVVLVSVQLTLHRDRVWLPGWLEKPSVSSSKVQKVIAWLRRPARFADKWTRPRMRWAVRHVFIHIIAMLCIVIAAATPLMELIPFSANVAGLAISAFALAIFMQDGLIAIIAAVLSIATISVVVIQFL